MASPFRNRRLRRLAVLLLAAGPLGLSAAGTPAVVTAATENLYVRPDETGPVDSQAILGDRVDVLEDAAGFAKVRTADGNVAWVPERSIRRGAGAEAPAGGTIVARVTSNFAHVYVRPSFTSRRPLLTAPLGARLEFRHRLDGKKGDSGAPGAGDASSWFEVRLPDGRDGFIAERDVSLLPFEDSLSLPLRAPSDWIVFGRRFLGAPYTWGGTTPLGFDCSGLMQRILSEHGVTLKRNSFEQAFQDPRLVPVAPDKLEAGDLLFFGTEEKIDHEAMWVGDGTVLQSTRHGVPGVQVTPFDSPFLKPLFRYARRLAVLPGAPKPGLADAGKRRALEARLAGLSGRGGAAWGIAFKDLTTGETVLLGADRTMHAASTMKTAVLLEALRRTDEGTLRLTDEIPVKNEFRSLADGSPFSVGLEPETDGPTAARLGGTAPLEFLLREMIVRSSNLATNVVLTLLVPESVQAFTDALGAPTVKVRRCVEDSKAFDRGLNNTADAKGMAALMEAAVRTPRLSPAAKAKAWEILAGQLFGDQIPAGLHPQSGAVVGHKTGSISSVQHDAAVVRLPDGREYVLVLLADDFGATEEGRKRVKETSRRMSRAVWEHMVAP